jgi:perosamine synthetase
MQASRIRSLVEERHKELSNAQGSETVPLRSVVQRLAGITIPVLARSASVTTQADGIAVTQITASHARRRELRITLLTPTGLPGPFPTVLVSAGLNATLDRVTGVARPDHPDRNVAERLCRNGFATVTMDYGLGDEPAAEAMRLGPVLSLAGESLLGALVEDTLAVLGWARTLADIDPARIGLFGHSLGAAVALHTALLLDEPLPVCTAGHCGTYGVLYASKQTGPQGGYLPGILRHADLPDLYAALAPAPLEIQYGLRDPFIDVDDAVGAEQQIIAAYREADGVDVVRVRAIDMGHGTDINGAAAFFGRHLATAPNHPPVPVPAGRVHFDVASRREILDRVDAALASGSLTLGRYGRQLEALAEPWTGTTVAAVSSGSAALEIALRIIGVQGRTVLVQSNTFFATAASALRAGASVQFVDIELDGLGMDPGHLGDLLDLYDDVAAVIPVHIAGVVSPALETVLDLCRERGIDVVEDAAHALGATLHGQPAGSFGRMSAFSLYPTKVATSGEGGLVGCPQQTDLDAVHRYRDQGKASFTANVHAVLGSNWRMSEVHAAVGIAQLQRLAAALQERQRLAAHYHEGLIGLGRARAFRPPPASVSNYYKFVVLLDPDVDRDALRHRLLQRHGVSLAGAVYDTLASAQPYFQDAFAGSRLPQATWFARHHICLPLFAGLTRAQQEAVVSAVHAELA